MTKQITFTAWELNIEGLPSRLQKLYNAGDVSGGDTVWCGEDGSAIIGGEPDEDAHTEYIESGDVWERINNYGPDAEI